MPVVFGTPIAITSVEVAELLDIPVVCTAVTRS
jgi:hypothetical protein